MDIKIINQKLDEADGKTFLPFRLIVKKFQAGELIDWDYCSDLENWKLLEDNRVLFKDENEPYLTQQSPEFLRLQQIDLKSQLDQAKLEQNAREAKAEQIRLLGIQLGKQEHEEKARKIIDSHQTQDELHQKEIMDNLARVEKEKSLSSNSPSAVSPTEGDPLQSNENLEKKDGK